MLKKRTLSLFLVVSVLLSLLALGGMISSAETTIPDMPAGRQELATAPTQTDPNTIAAWDSPMRIELGAGQSDYIHFGGFTGLTSADSYVLKATFKVTDQKNPPWSGPELVLRIGADGTDYRVKFQADCTYFFRGTQNFSSTTKAGEFYTLNKAFTVAAVVTPQRTDIFMDGNPILSYSGANDETYQSGTPAFRIYGNQARVEITNCSAYNSAKESYVPTIPDGITNLATGIRANDGGNYFAVWKDPVVMNPYSGRDLYVDYAGFTGVNSADTYHLVFPLCVTAQANNVWSGPEIVFRTDADGEPYRLVLQGNSSYLFAPGKTDAVASAAKAGEFYTLKENFTVELTVSPAGVEVLFDGKRILGYDPAQAADTSYAAGTPCVRICSGSSAFLLSQATIWNTPHAHTAGEWETVTEPTVTTTGEKVRRCTICSEIVDRETIDKLPRPLDPNTVPGMPKGAANLADPAGAAGDTIFTVKNGRITAKAAESGTLNVPVTPAGLEDSTYVLSFIVALPADAEDWTGFEIVTNRSGDRTQSLIFYPNVIYLTDNGQNQAECTNVKLPRGRECKADIVFTHTEDGRLARRVFIDGEPTVNNWSGSSEMILDALAPALQIRSRSSAYTMRQVRLYAADPDATEFEPDESDGGTADSGDSRPEDSGSDPEKPDDSKADNSSGSPDTGAALPCAALLTALGALAAVFGSKKRRS